ncbi:hypothetical protein HYW36_01825 [Candidatus Saccharibacteria bacterium]|nr:hypothetical protein [Candidatus Saccharibacteria bacterium]
MKYLFFAANELVDKANLPQAQADAKTIRTVFTIIFVVIGALALLFLVIAGVRYVFSQGDPDDVKRSKAEIKYAIIGLIIAFLAIAIVNFVIDKL